ncbi:polysaccharide biosynthesis tyrosine autokinase [Spongisporangium articulatum]|uniref:Polysaccharide biosynthesis tyrosine autokinase n=1 Tax=Spongisporangium articulatum TaxID=3362603 RepID=A0ABW8AVF0_9ACTN
MTLTQYLTSFKRQWHIAVLLTALVMAAAAAYTFTRTPQYSATSQVYVNVVSTEGSTLSSNSTFVTQRVKTYGEMATISDLLKQVNSDLQLDYTIGQLRSEITVKTPVDTNVILITAGDASPQRAKQIADQVAKLLPTYVDKVEKVNGQTSPVVVTPFQLADVPTSPVSPNVPLNLAAGLILGLAIGLGSAFLRDQLNTTLKSVTDIEAITGAVPLGIMPFDKTTSAQPLVDANDQSGRAEAYRSLRTNLQFTNVDHPPRVVVVTSSLPGEGKSTTSCNLALTLALNGATTVLIGGDLRKPTLSSYLGISSAVGLTNVLAGQYGLQEVLVPFMKGKLAVLPSGPTPPNPSELLDSAQMRKIVTVLSDKFEYVVIDAPPVLPVTDGALLAAMADGALIVTRHGKTTRDNLQRTLQALHIVNAKVLGTVINFAPMKRGSGYEGYGYGYGYTSQEQANGTRHAHGAGAAATPRMPQGATRPATPSNAWPADLSRPINGPVVPPGQNTPSGSEASWSERG